MSVTMLNAVFWDVNAVWLLKKYTFSEERIASIIGVTRSSSQRASVVSYC
jgi:hypothetical protein